MTPPYEAVGGAGLKGAPLIAQEIFQMQYLALKGYMETLIWMGDKAPPQNAPDKQKHGVAFLTTAAQMEKSYDALCDAWLKYGHHIPAGKFREGITGCIAKAGRILDKECKPK